MTHSAFYGIAVASLFLVPFGASAAEANCGGPLSRVMADHPNCGGDIAFKTEATGGTQGRWMCTKSKEAGSMVLAALIAGRPVIVYVEVGDVGGLCAQVPNYRDINYVIMEP